MNKRLEQVQEKKAWVIKKKEKKSNKTRELIENWMLLRSGLFIYEITIDLGNQENISIIIIIPPSFFFA